MKLYQVGPDELSNYDIQSIKSSDYFVYHYESGSYDGSGTGIAKRDGKFYSYNLSHCSCFGPIDGVDVPGELYDLHSEKVELTGVDKEVLEKVLELEG
jgi:hypothetical protein